MNIYNIGTIFNFGTDYALYEMVNEEGEGRVGGRDWLPNEA